MDAKSGARERFDSVREDLVELSHRIHANPELAFEEEKASSWLCEYLDAAGFSEAFAPNTTACPALATPAAITLLPRRRWAQRLPQPKWPMSSA